jgi:hypothetical protein
VGRITTAGQIAEYPIPNNVSGLVTLAHGSAVLHRAGRATIRLRFATRFLNALARARDGVQMTITAVSTRPAPSR